MKTADPTIRYSLIEKLALCCERGIYESVADVLTCRADLNLTPVEVRLLTARTEWIWAPE